MPQKNEKKNTPAPEKKDTSTLAEFFKNPAVSLERI